MSKSFSGRKWGKRRYSRWQEDLQWHEVTEVLTCLEEGDKFSVGA